MYSVGQIREKMRGEDLVTEILDASNTLATYFHKYHNYTDESFSFSVAI